MTATPSHFSLFGLLQFASAASPVGSFAYSDGLEYAVSTGLVTDQPSTHAWIEGLFRHSVCGLDLPCLRQIHATLEQGNVEAALLVSAQLLACRDSREVRERERTQGLALMKLLRSLDVALATTLPRDPRISYVFAFALACQSVRADNHTAAIAYAFAWAENTVAAAIKLVPLGQTDGQRILHGLRLVIDAIPVAGEPFDFSRLAPSTPGLAICCGLHETQSTRLFRS